MNIYFQTTKAVIQRNSFGLKALQEDIILYTAHGYTMVEMAKTLGRGR